MRTRMLIYLTLIVSYAADAQEIITKPWIWSSDPPADCPFMKSEYFTGLAFTGRHSDYKYADTWYPSWASDDKLYSPYTDGGCPRLDGSWEYSNSGQGDGKFATTGQAVLEGNDPVGLKVYSLGLNMASSDPYTGRYPCGSLVHNGIWYYGTYCLDPAGSVNYGNFMYNWPWLGPFVGFRISKDFGRTWTECPLKPGKPLFGETGKWGYPVKIGSPHFVDFGKNMEHSPDGKAYLVAHGADKNDLKPRFANASWITGDQIYLLRVTPDPETINDSSQYEFFGGYEKDGNALWVTGLSKAKPILEWNNNMGCVTLTYNAPLKKYLMCITDGVNTVSYMNTYILESDKLTGPWKIVTYMKHFGEQGYFVNIPSKFISSDGKTAWLCYSAFFSQGWNNIKFYSNPPGGRYGLVLQEIKLLDKEMYNQYKDNPRPEIK
jgi:hypothetical protein